MPSLLRALTPYDPPPFPTNTTAAQQVPLRKNDLALPLSKPKNGWTLIKNLHTTSTGWVPTHYLGKPSKGFYRATTSLGSASTPTSPVLVKIKRDEMIEITNVSAETWNYKKLDGSGATGLVNPTCLVKVELDTEPPAYPPPAGPRGLRAEEEETTLWKEMGKGAGDGTRSPPLASPRKRWSIFGSMRRGRPSPTIEAKARTPLETDGKGLDVSGRLGEGQEGYFDAAAVRSWSAQVEGDGGTLSGKTLGEDTGIGDGGSVRVSESASRPAAGRHEEEGAVWLGSA